MTFGGIQTLFTSFLIILQICSSIPRSEAMATTDRNASYHAFVETLPSLKGKTIAITGTTSGTGYVSAKVAAERGAELVLLNRPSAKADAALKRLREAVPDATFVPIECDLTDFASVKKACKEVCDKYSKLYCVANNAGILGYDDIATKDGYDITIQTNYLSTFIITATLFPLLEAGAKEYGDARIVQHSSGGRHGNGQAKKGTIPNWGLDEKYFGKNGGNLGGNAPKGDMDMTTAPYVRYYQSKLANSVLMHGIHNKLGEESKIRSTAAHPGVAATDLSDHVFPDLDKEMMMQTMCDTPEVGAIGLMTAMMAPDVESGCLYGPEETRGPVHVNPPEPYETDPEAIKMLWEKSEEATGVNFDI